MKSGIEKYTFVATTRKIQRRRMELEAISRRDQKKVGRRVKS